MSTFIGTANNQDPEIAALRRDLAAAVEREEAMRSLLQSLSWQVIELQIHLRVLEKRAEHDGGN